MDYVYKLFGRDRNRGTGTGTGTVTEGTGSPSDFAAGKTSKGPFNPQHAPKASSSQDAPKASSSQDVPLQQVTGMDQPKTGHRRERIQRLVHSHQTSIATYKDLIGQVPIANSTEYNARLRVIGQAFSKEAQAAATNRQWPHGSGRAVREQTEKSMDGGIEQFTALITEMQAAANSENVESFQEKQKFISDFLQDNKEHPEINRYNTKYQTIQNKYLPLQNNFNIDEWDQRAEDIQDLHKQIAAEKILDQQHKRDMQRIQGFVRGLLGSTTESSEQAASLTMTPIGSESEDPDQATDQGLWNTLEKRYGKSRRPDQRQNIFHDMTTFCYDLLQRDFVNMRAFAANLLAPDSQIDIDQRDNRRYDIIMASYNELAPSSGTRKIDDQIESGGSPSSPGQGSHTRMTSDTATPHQLQDVDALREVHTEMKSFHNDLIQGHFVNNRLYAQQILNSFPDNEFKIISQERYDAITTRFGEIPDSSPYQLQNVYTQMTELYKDLMQRDFENIQARSQQYKADIETLLNLRQDDIASNELQNLDSASHDLEPLEAREKLNQSSSINHKLLEVQKKLENTIYEQTHASIENLLSQFTDAESKTQLKDLEAELKSLDSQRQVLDSEREEIAYFNKKHVIMYKLHHLHNKLAGSTFDRTQSRIQQLLPMLAEDEFKQTSQTKHAALLTQRSQQEIAADQSSADKMTIRDWQESARSSQTWQRLVADLLDLHSNLAQEAIKQTHISAEQLLRLFRIKPPVVFEALTKRCREDLFSPNARSADQSPADDIRNWQKNEKNAKAHAHNWQEVVKALLNFHKELTNKIYQQAQRDIQPLITQIQDSSNKSRYQKAFDNQQTEYSESTNPGQRQHVLQRMADSHKDLLQDHFKQDHTYIQHLLDHQIQDSSNKSRYQKDLDALQTAYPTSSNSDSQHWQKGKDEIRVLRSNVVDHAWKEVFQQLQAKIDTLLQDLQEGVTEDQYRTEYAILQQNYGTLSQEGQKLSASDTHYCYREMGLFYTKLSEAREMNRREIERQDDTKEMEHYANDLERQLQRHIGRVQRVWPEKDAQGQLTIYANFTDLEGKEHAKKVVQAVEVVDDIYPTTQKTIGYYCSETRHFISFDHQTVHDTQLIGDRQLKLKDTRETPWEQQLRQWAKPADTKARRALEGAKQRIWKVLSREDSPALFELSLGFHGSYLSKTTISGSDADIHVAFNNRPINNPFYNDLPKYKEIMNNALIKAFAPEHVSVYETVTTIAEGAFGTEADVFPAFYHTFEGGHKGLISFTDNEEIVTHFLEQKRHNTQEKSERTAYRSRSVVRIIKYLREMVSENRETIPSFIIEALVHNTPNDHLVNYTSENEPIKRDLAATLNRFLKYCTQHTATDEECKEWKEADGIKYLFNFDANTPWNIELKGVTYTYSGKHSISREKIHDFLKRLQEYIKKQQEGQFQSIQLSRPLEGHRRRGT